MKTNTPPNTQTQARIQQLNLEVDWHADHFRVVRDVRWPIVPTSEKVWEEFDGWNVAIIRF